MFWNKKVEVEGMPITLSKRVGYITDLFGRKQVSNSFLAYKDKTEWRGLVGYEQYREEVDEVMSKLNLILDHLNLKYVPESDKKVPAKLEEKTRATIYPEAILRLGGAFVDTPIGVEIKKKRKYTKRKKSKK